MTVLDHEWDTIRVPAGPAQKERNPGGGTPRFLEIGESGGTDLIFGRSLSA